MLLEEKTNAILHHSASVIKNHTAEIIYTQQIYARSRQNYDYPTLAPKTNQLYQTIFEPVLTQLQSQTSYTPSDGQQILLALQELQQQVIDSMATHWDNGGIKGTIFADQNKKNKILTKLDTELTNINTLQQLDSNVITQAFEQNTFAVIQSVLLQAENIARQIEYYNANFFFSRIIIRGCNYYTPLDFFVNIPDTLPIHQLHHGTIMLGEYVNQYDFDLKINGKDPPTNDIKRRYYYVPTTTKGKQKYTVDINLMPSYRTQNNPYQLSKTQTYEVVE